MKKKKIMEICLAICVTYTLLSLLNAALALSQNYKTVSAMNHFTMIIWTAVGTGIIYTYPLFNRFSPVVTMLLQYTLAITIIMSHIYISGYFEILHPDAYKDGFISFTIPYIVGGGLHYFYLFASVKKQNKWLKEIQLNQGKIK